MSPQPTSPGSPSGGSPLGTAATPRPMTQPAPGAPGAAEAHSAPGATGASSASSASSATPARSADAGPAGLRHRLLRRKFAASASEPGQRQVFRLTAPVVIWWIWLAFAAVNLVDLGLEASGRFALVVGALLVTITGVAYAAAYRARVVADDTGITVLNPVREYRVPWAAVRDVDVRDWVRIYARTTPGADTTKTVESWALFATARVKRNYTVRARTYAEGSPDAARLPDEAKRLMSQPTVVIIARQIEQRARKEQARGAPDGVLKTGWAWPSIAAMLVPALALLIILLTDPL